MTVDRIAGQTERPALLVAATSVFAVNSLLEPHIEHLSETHDITLVSCSVDHPLNPNLEPLVTFIDIPIDRSPKPVKDMVLLVRLIVIIARLAPVATLTITPKIGLFVAIAAVLCRVKKRIHIFAGQVWHTKTGLSRAFFKFLDRILVRTTTNRLADSATQIEFLEDQKIVGKGKIALLGNGSVRGIRTDRFHIDTSARRKFRKANGCDEEDLIVLFLGRVVRDKGVFDAMQAMTGASRIIPNLRFWMAGPDEEQNSTALAAVAEANGLNFEYFGKVPETIPYFQAADLLILPSRREGFGLVIVEAAACGTPAIAYDTYGVSDAIANHQSGILVDYENVEALEAQLVHLLKDAPALAKMGQDASERAHRMFAEHISTASLAAVVRETAR